MSRDIPVDLIQPDPNQPRKSFDPAAVSELAQSMASSGLIIPILIRPSGNAFIIVHGERRWRAARLLGWATIPAEVRELPADQARWLALIENIQRADLSPIEEALTYSTLLEQGETQTSLGQRIGKSQSYIAQKLRMLTLQSYIAQKLRMLTLPPPVLIFVERQLLTEGHGRQLLRLRGMYGEELTCALPPSRLLADANEVSDIDLALMEFALTLALHVESQPKFVFPGHPTRQDVIHAAYRAFSDYVVGQQYTIPLWVRGAFWWALVAVHCDLSVAELHKVIDDWYAKFMSALFWHFILDHDGQLEHRSWVDKDWIALLRAGYTADLQAGGILDYARTP